MAKKGVNRLALLQTLYTLMKWMYDFRIKYDFTEASMWDVIFIQIYYLEHSEGTTVNALLLKRYRKSTGYKALRQRLDVLIKRGLLIQENRRIYPSETLLAEFAMLGNPEALLLLAAKKAA